MNGRKDEPSRSQPASQPATYRVREPSVAGMFYPAEAETCRSAANSYVAMWRDRNDRAPEAKQLIGGVVPHAGWVCSGAIAGQTIGTIAATRTRAPDVVIVLGAVHTPLPIRSAALDDYERWAVPGSVSPVLDELRRALLDETRQRQMFAIDDRFHRREHAVEVELPLIAAAWPDCAIVPVEMPTVEHAGMIGREIALRLVTMKLDAVILASSDLTHYGPAYRFAPAGVGLNGIRWAKDNDRRLLDRIEQFDVDGIVNEVETNLNACGGGAIAAMLAACGELGANEARVLHHANSYETLAVIEPQPPDNAVGYASVVVG